MNRFTTFIAFFGLLVLFAGNIVSAETSSENSDGIQIIYPDGYTSSEYTDDSGNDAEKSSDSGEKEPTPEKQKRTPAAEQLFPVTGAVRERGTNKPLKNISFFITNLEKRVQTDDRGKFNISLPAGQHTVVVPVVGYEKLETVIQVFRNEKLTLTFRLDSKTVNPYTIVVRDTKKKGEVSAQRVSIQEAMKIPGANRDVLQSLTNLPGTNSITAFNGYGSGLIIRGSPPEDSLRHVNNHSLPLLYHFGGLDSVIEPEIVESIDYYAGGFGADYYNATGGVVQINLREPDSDIWSGYANLSLLSSSVMVEGPITDSDTIAVSVKRGFLDLYVMLLEQMPQFKELVDFSAYPSYYDINAAYTHEFSPASTLNVYGFWGLDDVRMTFEGDSESQKFDNSFRNTTNFFTVFSEWKYRKGKFTSVFSPSIEGTVLKLNMGNNAYFRNDFLTMTVDERMSFSPNDTHTVNWGFRFFHGLYRLKVDLFAPPKEGEVGYNPFENELRDHSSGYFWYPGFFVRDVITAGNVIISPGITAIFDPHNHKFMSDPRLSLKYNIGKQWTLKTAAGLYSKIPANDESYKPWGTPGLHPERSLHTIGGVEYRPFEHIEIDVQGFYKRFYNLIVRTDPDDPTVYGNEGKGYAYGAEVFIRHRLTDRFFGWLSYSWGVSRRLDALGPQGKEAEWRPFDMDINHNLKIIASYKFNKKWQLGARFSLTSGLPHTHLLNTDYTFDVDNNTVIPNYSGPVNPDRFPVQHQLDIRLDRYWIFDRWILSTYIDVQNVYLHRNVFAVSYNTDYTEEQNIALVPILIFIGVKGDF